MGDGKFGGFGGDRLDGDGTGKGPRDAVPGTPAHLAHIGNRTSLLALDALLAALPRQDRGYHEAALEARIIAKRLQSASADMRDAMDGCLSAA